MQAACFANSDSGKGNQIHNTLIRAENRAGQLLAELARATLAEAGTSGGHAKAGTSNDATCQQSPYAEALTTNGISRQTAHRFQIAAAIPQAGNNF